MVFFKPQANALQGRFRNLIRIFILISTGYILSSPFAPYPLSPIFKVLPIIVLTTLAWCCLSGKTRTLALLALLFSGSGDVFLALQFDNHFIFGLGSFLIAHLFYAVVFYHFRSHWKPPYKWILLIAIIIFGLTIYQIVIPNTGELSAAVTVYMTVIMITCGIAITTLKPGHRFVPAGALIFVLSDTIIAWDMFVAPIYLADIWIMTTYYLAQLLIVYGLTALSANTPSVAAASNNTVNNSVSG